MSRLLVIPLALLALLAGAMTWSGGGGVAKPADFRFIPRGDVITLDPNQMSYLQDIRIAYAMWEGLYSYHQDTLEPVPGVAERVDVNDDKTVYTFHLRRNAKWSNGDPVTTKDFVFAWRRMLETPGEYSYLFYYIKGAEQYLKDFQAFVSAPGGGAAPARPNFSTVGIEPLDDYTLRVSLNNPVTFMLELAGFPPFLPLHEPSMRQFAETDPRTGVVRYNQRFTRPPHVVTNGPYNLVAWDFKRRLRLEASDQYWDAANVKSKSIESYVVDDALTQLLRYESGSVDWVSEVPTEIAAELRDKGRDDLKSFDGYGTMFFTLMVRPRLRNGQPNPLADIRVRQALAMSIDKKQVVETITRMGERTSNTYIPDNLFEGWRAPKGYEFDVARARKLLADAGYPNGGKLPGVTYVFRSETAVSKDLAQNFVGQWKQNLNLDIPLEGQERKVVRQRLNDKDYTIALANWFGDYPDPSTFTDKYKSTSENNDSAWINARYDALLEQANLESDAVKRMRLFEQAEGILLAEAPIIPLYVLTNQFLLRDTVKGVNLSPRNMTMLKGVEVVRK
ncbi:MAG: peptide ABC transporter substrate-binding protein [Tepidisphaeraceae bacterium]